MCISALICMWSEPCLFPLNQNDWGIKLTARDLITRFRLCLHLPSLPCLLHGMVLEKAQGQFYISCVLKPIELTNIYLIIFMCKVLKCNNQQTNTMPVAVRIKLLCVCCTSYSQHIFVETQG